MIKKTIFFFLLFCSLYTLYILFIASDEYVENNFWQANLIKIEKYIYNKNEEKYTNVIVGSSLSNCIVLDDLTNIYSLSMGGLNSFDGLEIIRLSNKKPKKIYIEINKLYAQQDLYIKEKIFTQPIYYLRKNMIITQTQNQPISKIILFAENLYFKNNLENREFLKLKFTSTIDSNIFKEILNINYKNYSQHVDTNLIINNMSKLAFYMHYFSSIGTKMYFYETPINPKLYTLPIPVLTRKYLFQNFPKNKFNYLENDTTLYNTTDGIHLDYEGSKKYTNFFLKQINP